MNIRVPSVNVNKLDTEAEWSDYHPLSFEFLFQGMTETSTCNLCTYILYS